MPEMVVSSSCCRPAAVAALRLARRARLYKLQPLSTTADRNSWVIVKLPRHSLAITVRQLVHTPVVQRPNLL